MDPSQIAQACAGVILDWHQMYGLQFAAGRMDAETRTRYTTTLEDLQKLDLNEPESLLKIAETQRSGMFEWFYSEQIPEQLWAKYPDVKKVDRVAFRKLHEAAAYIISWRKQYGQHSPTQENSVRDRERLTVSRAELLERASEFYAAYRTEEPQGIGGMCLLLSCSLERSSAASSVTLLSPVILGLKRINPGSRPEDLLDRIRNGELKIEEVTGES